MAKGATAAAKDEVAVAHTTLDHVAAFGALPPAPLSRQSEQQILVLLFVLILVASLVLMPFDATFDACSGFTDGAQYFELGRGFGLGGFGVLIVISPVKRSGALLIGAITDSRKVFLLQQESLEHFIRSSRAC